MYHHKTFIHSVIGLLNRLKNADKEQLKAQYEVFKKKAYIIIYGTNTPLGKLFDIILLGLIIISVLMVMLETVEGVDQRLHGLLVFMEWVITVFFTMEYILRIITNNRPYRYIFSLYGIIDLIALLPMYLSFITPSTKAISVVRALRLLRVFRILDLVSFMRQGKELKNALYNSKNKIIIFTYFVLVICVLLGSVMYVVESNESGFTSIPRSIYWCIVTMTTVGYGDIAPQTTMGQMIAAFIMILGYGIIAVPTGIVTAEYTRMKTQRRLCKHCNYQNQPEAKYCSQCGNELKEPITNASKK